jgi:hypothetical protein
MMKISLVGWVSAIALIGVTTACTPSSAPPTNESGTASESVDGRATYSEVPLPPDDKRFGATPEEVALGAFGITEPVEGNFTQEVKLIEQTPSEAVVTLTQTGLPDDSVEGRRYWLEFTAGENQWEMVWAGRQVRCRLNRGSQEWSTDLCN